jgi:predicted SprT family Zn-dependent metalloprotease
METKSFTATAIQQHNAQTDRQAEIVKEIDRMLRLMSFPYERVWVDVRFDYTMTDHSASKMKLLSINGEHHGVVEIRLQPLFIWQDFETFFNEVIPHELAHVIQELRAALEGRDSPKGHDDEWMDLVMEMNPDIEPSAKVKGWFDDRPIKLHKGAIPCACDCDDMDAFAVFANTNATVVKLKNDELSCQFCLSPYRRIGNELWPAEIIKAMEFYRYVQAEQVQHPALSR